MIYTIKLEAIGDNIVFERRMKQKHGIPWAPRRSIDWNAQSPWVARITGWSTRGGFVREFVKGQKDYTECNNSGSRGIWIYYHLDPGIYEVNEIPGFGKVKRYFLQVCDGKGHTISPREAVLCLQS